MKVADGSAAVSFWSTEYARPMHFDFRFRNSDGKWESAGHRRGADRASALEALAESTDGGLRPGRYMSRPRSRQKDWDLFSLDADGAITTKPDGREPDLVSPPAAQWLR